LSLHGAVADKKLWCTQSPELLCRLLLRWKGLGYNLKIVKNDLIYHLFS
jgi:hypothetical protein